MDRITEHSLIHVTPYLKCDQRRLTVKLQLETGVFTSGQVRHRGASFFKQVIFSLVFFAYRELKKKTLHTFRGTQS